MSSNEIFIFSWLIRKNFRIFDELLLISHQNANVVAVTTLKAEQNQLKQVQETSFTYQTGREISQLSKQKFFREKVYSEKSRKARFINNYTKQVRMNALIRRKIWELRNRYKKLIFNCISLPSEIFVHNSSLFAPFGTFVHNFYNNFYFFNSPGYENRDVAWFNYFLNDFLSESSWGDQVSFHVKQ